MLVTPIQPLCPLGMLAAIGLGFLLAWRRDFAPSAYSTRENAVLAARYYSSLRPAHPLPTLPRSIFYSSLLFITFLVLHGFCPQLRSVFWLPLVCTLSAGAWLLSASNLQRMVGDERKQHIVQFVADPQSPVPEPVPDLEVPPQSLKLWHRFNLGFFRLMLAGFILLMWLA